MATSPASLSARTNSFLRADGDGLIRGKPTDSIDAFRKAVKFAPNDFWPAVLVSPGQLAATRWRGTCGLIVVEMVGMTLQLSRTSAVFKELATWPSAIAAYRKCSVSNQTERNEF
jgi:hypothetical protein